MVGVLAAEVMAKAIVKAIKSAKPLYGKMSYSSFLLEKNLSL